MSAAAPPQATALLDPKPSAAASAPRRGAGRVVVEARGAGRRCEVTRLRSSYPLRLLAPRAPGSRAAWCFAVTFGGGVLAGDWVEVDAEVCKDAALALATQSSTKVYRAPPGVPPAQQVLRAGVARGALLAVVPEPVQAFARARYRQMQAFELEEGGSLALVDWLSAGRPANGEAWAFDEYASSNTIRVGGALLVADNMHLRAGGALGVAERMGACRACATVVLLGPRCARAAREALAATTELSRALLAATPASAVLSEGAGGGAAPSAPPLPPAVKFSASASELPGGVGVAVRVAGERLDDVAGFIRALLMPLEEELGRAPYS